MSIFIKNVRVKNFRSLKNVSVNLSEITLLVGANNSGKTTFLRALSLAFNGERKFWGKEDLFVNKDGESLPQVEQIISIDVKITPFGNDEFEDLWVQTFGEDINSDENGQDFFAFRTTIDFSDTEREAQIKRYVINDWDSDEADEKEISANLNPIPFYFMDAQRDLESDLRLRTSNFGKLMSDIQYDETKQTEIETLLKTINNEAVEHSEVLKHLKEALEELNKTVSISGKGVEISPFTKRIRDLSKGVNIHFQDGGSDSFSLEHQGMGTRSWASLLALKAKIGWDAKKATIRNDVFFPILALEEPEAHLHPNAITERYKI